MNTFDVLVPHGRELRNVIVDGLLATHVTTHSYPGFGFSVQTWQANLGREPRVIALEFK